MSLSHTILLGLIAGGTIFLGLPVGRLRRMPPGLRVFLSAVAVGVLVFLVWDVLS
ncbi:MAG: zinc transporter, family, partial [Gaiellales bacterium]|nr:zinc transporter, family [Gaiellales bacterium]